MYPKQYVRVLRVLQTTAAILIISNMVLLYAISNLHSQRNFNVVTKIIHKPSEMVVQKLYLIYTNGYTLNMGAHYLFKIISCPKEGSQKEKKNVQIMEIQSFV